MDLPTHPFAMCVTSVRMAVTLLADAGDGLSSVNCSFLEVPPRGGGTLLLESYDGALSSVRGWPATP